MFIIVIALIYFTICDGFGVISPYSRDNFPRMPWASRFTKQTQPLENKAGIFVRPQRNQLFRVTSAIFAAENSENAINPEDIAGEEDDEGKTIESFEKSASLTEFA